MRVSRGAYRALRRAANGAYRVRLVLKAKRQGRHVGVITIRH